jgi:hypothetical protein
MKAITNYNEELQVEISNKIYYFAYHTSREKRFLTWNMLSIKMFLVSNNLHW